MKFPQKIFAVAMLTVGGISAMNAETLTPEAALSRAIGTNLPNTALSVAKNDAKLIMTQTDGDAPTVYVFANTAAGDGYLVVSADDVAPGLLGYSDATMEGEMPPALKYWIEEYGRQIEWARSAGMPSFISASKAPDTKEPIEPLTTTRWNQNAPFNNDCPTINGKSTVTGCVATALSQIMKYHNWPVTGTGSNSYTPSAVGTTVSCNFGNTTFDWANMVDVYDNSSTASQKAAVAKLMFAAGVSVNMNYTTSESSATSFAAAQAMINYFKYDKGLTYYNRNYYDLDTWNDLVYNQLKTYGPVQYSGQSNDGGHSFVCDGYSRDGYFHINWGWGGMSDGYFLLTALDPITQGIGGSTSGYNFSQDIIGNVKPADASSPSTVIPNFVADSFVVSSQNGSSTSVSLGNVARVYGPEYSFSLAPVSGKYGIKVVGTDGTTTYYAGSSYSNLSPMSGVYAYYVTLPASIKAGTYAIYPAVQDNAGNWYDVAVQVGSQKTTSMTVAGGVATFSTTTGASITVSDVQPQSQFYIGSKFEIAATISNSGDEEYLGQIRLMLINSSGQAVAQGDIYPVDLVAGDSEDITYLSSFAVASGTTLTPGQYYICFVDAQGNQISDMSVITLNAAATPTLSVSNFTIEGGTIDVDRNNINFTADVSCTSGYFGDALTVVVFPYRAGSVTSEATFTSSPMFISAGQTVQLKAGGSFPTATPGGKYFAMLYKGNQQASSAQLIFTISTSTGVNDAVTEATPLEISYFTIDGLKVDGTTPGLYVVRTTYSDGTVSSAKTVVR